MINRHHYSLQLRIIKLPDFNCIFVEIIQQAGVDPHFAEILLKRLPMGATATGRAMMDADHAVAPHIGLGFARYCDLFGRIIGNAPPRPATQRAITICHPTRRNWQFDTDIPTVTASGDAHHFLVLG